jgi:hypothetical protein
MILCTHIQLSHRSTVVSSRTRVQKNWLKLFQEKSCRSLLGTSKTGVMGFGTGNPSFLMFIPALSSHIHPLKPLPPAQHWPVVHFLPEHPLILIPTLVKLAGQAVAAT